MIRGGSVRPGTALLSRVFPASALRSVAVFSIAVLAVAVLAIAPGPARAEDRVQLDGAAPERSVDGATLVLRDSGERLYFSSRLATFLTMAERRDVFRRLIGREVALEGAFLARVGRGSRAREMGGIAAVTGGHAGGVAIAYIRTFPGEDRVVDFFAREREMRAVSITGVGDQISCLATDWLPSTRSTFAASDFRQQRCRLLRGRAFGVD